MAKPEKLESYSELLKQQFKQYAAKYQVREPLDIFWSELVTDGVSPLWWLPLAEKPIPPHPKDTFAFRTSDRRILKELDTPSEFTSVDIERERLTSGKGNNAVVERIYFQSPNVERLLKQTSILEDQGTYSEAELYLLTIHHVNNEDTKSAKVIVTQKTIDSFFTCLKPIASLSNDND